MKFIAPAKRHWAKRKSTRRLENYYLEGLDAIWILLFEVRGLTNRHSIKSLKR